MLKKYKVTIWALSVAVIAMLAFVIALLIITANNKNEIEYGEFIPPKFDENAVIGLPDVPKELGYTEVYSEGMPYKAHVCGALTLYNMKYVDVYFTNDAENDVWLKLRLIDDDGNTVGETGLIKPGEYVKTVELSGISVGDDIKLKIMSYEPETYYSMGAVTLNTKIGGK